MAQCQVDSTHMQGTWGLCRAWMLYLAYARVVGPSYCTGDMHGFGFYILGMNSLGELPCRPSRTPEGDLVRAVA